MVSPNVAVENLQVLRGTRVVTPPVAANPVTYVAVGIATETDSAFLLDANPYARLVNLASETDTALAATRLKTKPVGLSSETDTAFAMTVLRTYAVGLASETDSATVTGKSKVKAIGLTDEPNTALPITLSTFLASVPKVARGVFWPALVVRPSRALKIPPPWLRTVTTGLASETDTATATGKAKAKQVGISSEADVAQTIGKAKVKQIGLASETNTALDLDADPYARLVNLATETDASLSIAVDQGTAPAAPPKALRAVTQHRKDALRSIGSRIYQAKHPSGAYIYEYFAGMETDTAFSITVVVSPTVDPAIETDTALPIAWAPKHRLVNPASETDQAQSFGSISEPYLPPPAVYKGRPQDVPHLHERSTVVGGLVDTGGSQYGPPSWDQSTPNVALHAGSSRTTGKGNVISAVPAFDRQEPVDPIAQVLNFVNTPGPFNVGTEIDESLAITVRRTYALGIAVNTNTAFQISRSTGVWTANPAQETDTAFALTIKRNRYTLVGIAQESDTARAMTAYTYGPRVIPVGINSSFDVATPIDVVAVFEPRRNRQYGRYSLRNQRR